jgi:formylmethanofuran dehydrogenase subunit E
LSLESVDVSVSDELIKNAVDFHGHFGPFLILGLKAGLLANAFLGKNCFKTKAIVTTNPSPPHSCFVDGVQFVTGCTMGKGNIKLRKGSGLVVFFSRDDKSLKLRLKNEILKSICEIASEEETRIRASDLLGMSVAELFEIEIRELLKI